jgi:RecA/RadA recombinase
MEFQMAKKKAVSGGFTTKQKEQMDKLHDFMKAQSKKLDFSLKSVLLQDRVGRNGATPTSSLCVDLITGGGIPKHRLTTISGLEGSGKTTLMQSVMANQVQKPTLVHYADFEGAADGSWMKNGTGVDFSAYEGKTFFPLLDMPTGDDFFRYIIRLMDESMKLGVTDFPEATHLFCLDSVPSLVPESLIENDEKGDKPYIALMLGKWLPSVRAKLKPSNSTMIAINQIRQKIRLSHPKENPQYEPGGNTIRFLADLKIRIDAVKCKHVGSKEDHSLIEKDGVAFYKNELMCETNPDGTIDSYAYRRVKTGKNRVFPSMKETFIRICTSHHGGEGIGIDPVFDTLYFFEEIGRLTWTNKKNVQLDGKPFAYFDLKAEIERPNSELRQEALALMDSGKAFEPYFARLGNNLGKVTSEEAEDETDSETEDEE